jgi:hypothetical protein
MTNVTGHYTLDLTELPAKAPDLRIRFVPQLVNRKNTALVLYPNAEPGFEPSYVRYVVMMEFRHLLLRERVILIVQGRGQLVVTGQRLVGMITDGSMGKVSLNESVGSVYAFAFDLDDIRPVEIKENWRGKTIEAIIHSKVGQSSMFGLKVFSPGPGLPLLLEDDGQVIRTSLSAFLDQLTPESRRNLQVAQENSRGRPIPAHDSTVLPSDWSDWPGRLNNLGAELLYGYELVGNLADLEAAISYLQQAIQAAPSDSPGWPDRLSNLAAGLRDRYEHTRDLADLDAAIAAWEKSWSNSRFAALPVAYQLGQQLQGAIVADNLITSYLEQAVQRLSHTPSSYNRALEVVEGSKSRLLTQLVGRGPLPLPSGFS